MNLLLSTVPADDVLALAQVAQAAAQHDLSTYWFSIQWLNPYEQGWKSFGTIEQGVVLEASEHFLQVYDAGNLYEELVPTTHVVAVRFWDAQTEIGRKAKVRVFDAPSRSIGDLDYWYYPMPGRVLSDDPDPLEACGGCYGPMQGQSGVFCPDCLADLRSMAGPDEAQALLRP